MNDFNRAAREARERNEFSLAKRIDAERRMARALVKEAILLDYTISVHDGDSYVLKKSKDQKTILSKMYSTDEEMLYLYEDDQRIGWFHLVYGNDGYDVVSDYSDNDECNDIWNRILKPLSDKIEAGK